jgi:hypothetical protein
MDFTHSPLRVVLLISLCLAFPASLVGQAAAPLQRSIRIVDYPEDEGVQLGNGWNSNISAKTPGTCIAFVSAQDKGEDKYLRFRSVHDKAEFQNELDVSAELQVKGIAYNVTGKTRFAKNVDVKDEFSNFVVHAIVQNGLQFVAPIQKKRKRERTDTNTQSEPLSIETAQRLVSSASPPSSANQPPRMSGPDLPLIFSYAGGTIDLAPDFKDMARDDPPNFLATCGDSFVAALHSGAELSAALTFRVRSNEEKQKLTLALEGSGWGMQASAALSSAIKTYSESKQLELLFHETGGSGQPLPTDQEGLLAQINNLPLLAAGAPRPYRITLQRYDSLPTLRALLRQQTSLTDVQRIAEQFGRLQTLWSDLQSIIANPQNYILDQGVTLQELRDIQDDIGGHLKSLVVVARACADGDHKNCKLDNRDAASDYEYRIKLPALANSFTQDAQIRQLRSDVKDLTDTMAAIIKRPCGGFGPGGAGTSLIICPTQKTKELQAKQLDLDHRTQLLQSLQEGYGDALRNAIMEQWVRPINASRCRETVSTGCLNNKQQSDLQSRIQLKTTAPQTAMCASTISNGCGEQQH